MEPPRSFRSSVLKAFKIWPWTITYLLVIIVVMIIILLWG